MIWLSFFVKTGVVELCLVFVDFAAFSCGLGWAGLACAGLAWPGFTWAGLLPLSLSLTLVLSFALQASRLVMQGREGWGAEKREGAGGY